MTVHNPAYQGNYPPEILDKLFMMNFDLYENGKLRFMGENKHFSRGNKSFTLVGSLNESKKFICESFTYNYRAKTPAGKATRVYGTVSYKNK